jgi:DNA-binding transcriptional LysR family regulator
MELRNLRALVEVAKCGGFSHAAKSLGTTQSTISKAILQLEHDCGVRLIERLGRGIRLTDAGEIARQHAINMLSERDLLLSEIGQLRGLQRGRLKLGLPVLAGSALFAWLVASFRKKYPQIEVELRESGCEELETDVRRGQIEVGASLLPISDDFDHQIVREEPLIALLPVEHPLSSRPSVKLKELAPCPTIFFEDGFALNTLLIDGFRQRKMDYIDAGHSANPDFMIAMVAAGLGIAFLPHLILKSRDYRSVRAVKIEDENMWWRLALIWRRGHVLSPAARRWLEMAALSSRKNDRTVTGIPSRNS